MDLVWIIVALLIGLLIGAGIAFLVMRRRYGDRESVVQLRNEFDQYRNKVTEHFVETADLMNTLTRNYKNVYDHLEDSAYELVGEDTLRKRLDAVDEAPVMIEYMGQRRTEEETTASAETSAASSTMSRAKSPTAAREKTPELSPKSSGGQAGNTESTAGEGSETQQPTDESSETAAEKAESDSEKSG
jgi:uncharacterized membrane-anchored protein YhcB (DUF1043 family)